MTLDEKITMTKVLSGVDCDENQEVKVYLTLAQNAILQRLYPFGFNGKTLNTQYDSMQCELAARYLQRRGMEGEIGHNENGINRSFDSVNNEDILDRLVPYAKVGF